ncbi:hypothetical protein M9H77_27205 [Catharanthus roseus]|uniref:Uncharacterized protein n=1 Tax=Catharanthus roseus TaxID=4058 RepID=A0ACC0AEI7_CATRO|nr:hypothetical protein M9H77_27205 [Catharanthus roseus]
MCLDSLLLPTHARNPHFSAERHVNALLSRSGPSGRVGVITGGIRALDVICIDFCHPYFSDTKNSMYLVKWTLSLLLSQQQELSGPWFCIRYILSITSHCQSVNVKMEEVEPRIE